MQRLQERRLVPLTPEAAPDRDPVPEPLPLQVRPSLTKLLLVDPRGSEALHQHPEVAPFLKQGWVVRSTAPRLVEAKGPRLLVVLAQEHRASPLMRIK